MIKICLLLVGLIGFVACDTPANCTYEDVRGVWLFQEGPRGNDRTENCTTFKAQSQRRIQLEFPDVAIDEDGNVGFWTIVYNQGFEVVIQNRKYFAFSYYEKDGQNVTSYCDRTFNGWAHGTGVNPTDWSCYVANRVDAQVRKTYTRPVSDLLKGYHDRKLFTPNPEFVAKINSVQKSWKAKHYDFLNQRTISDLVRMAGGKNSRILSKPKPAPVKPEVQKQASALPASFDWRNVSGVNYVSPIRNQERCGSCYAFSSLAMNEARLRIQTNNTEQNVFSPQDIVECAQYSQGCDGGFPYLISGKYGEDFGLAQESCNPYTGLDGTCHTTSSCDRYYSTAYHYVGGFYGACNEAIMKVELVKNGPLVVAFEVYDDFFNYAGGVYHHTGLQDATNFKFNPFELTNHAVLLIGYGTTVEGENYWIVKNSWGPTWGESGFFRIRRGTDECAMESIAVGAQIIPRD